MALSVGTKVGSYEILGAIGAGGMGEVYRARDIRLGRDVAIKVLPAAFTSDPDRLARFEREARVLAALNHPHIAAIYGLEEAAGTQALVLELVEGETLASRIAQGLHVSEVLEIARQIADALDAAHEKGIVHRDLKPGNIMLTPAGVVKILDFGLAKLADAGPTPDLTHSPTMSGELTRGGVLLGTARYMSPEQARGQAVDKRTDIWAFGCVIYEMLTGRIAFPGATLTDTLAAIVDREPDWTALPATTPASVDQVLRRCLVKNPKRRVRDVGDAALEIEAAIDALQRPVPLTISRDRSAWWRAAAAVALVAAGTVAGVTWRGSSGARGPDVTVGPMTRLTSDAGLTTEPSISADGRLVAYASNRSGEGNLDVYVQQTTGGVAIRLTDDPADDHQPDVSPDGSLVAFRSAREPRGIYVASALGGTARLIAPDGMAPRFSPDGRSIAFWTGPWLAARSVNAPRRTFVVPAAGGTPTPVASDLASAGDPVWSPDGRRLLVLGRRATSGAETDADWWWAPIEGGAAVPTGAYERFSASQIAIDNPDTLPYPQVWTTDGVVFAAQGANADARSLWRIDVDARSGRVTGEPVRLTNGTTVDDTPSVAREGRTVFAALTKSDLHFALPLDANAGRPTGPLRHVRDDTAPTGRTSLSDDGRLLVFPKYEFASGGLWL